MASWMDPDGMYHEYGPDRALPTRGGEYSNVGALRNIEVRIALTEVGVNPTIMSDTIFFPKGVRIEEVEVITHTAATGAGAVLNVGLVRSTDRTTEIDFDGFVAALPLASMDAAGEKTVLRVGSTYAGAMIGTTTATYVGHITADYTTAAFTAGVIYVRIWYYAP